ncbi:GlmU family protein [Ascidiimonas sp. W6]|uniref:GlmU family protein n=1 Tax=Ascidiimonas meishanensis TaxID=3128903 RepID=UPI0030EEAF8F
MNFILFDGPSRNALLPFTYTRPVADIRIGMLTIREKWEYYLSTITSTLTEDYLVKKYPFAGNGDSICIDASILPNPQLVSAIQKLNDKQALICQDGVIAYRSKSGNSILEIGEFEKISYNNPITKISHTWDIFAKNEEAIVSDFELLTKGRKSQPIPETVQIKSPENIFIEDGAELEYVIINASAGPVYIGKNTKILDGSMLRGPLAICNGALVKMGAKIYGATTIGPNSKVGGEINNAVLFANSNKSHDGYLGNSVIGEWCNLGADTNTSNLKNNYAEVRLWNYEAERFTPTGLQFCGLMMGDHSKCGINTMFNTGTVIGVNVNIFGSGFPRNFVPSFSWGGASGFTTYQTKKAFEVMSAVVGRKDLEVSEEDIQIMEHVFEITKKWRKD